MKHEWLIFVSILLLTRTEYSVKWQMTERLWSKEQLIWLWRWPQSTFPAIRWFSSYLFILAVTSNLLSRKINVNSKWQEWFGEAEIWRCLLVICTFLFLHLFSLIYNHWQIHKIICLLLNLTLHSCPCVDRAVATGISNTRNQLNWLCQPLSITNMHAQRSLGE